MTTAINTLALKEPGHRPLHCIDCIAHGTALHRQSCIVLCVAPFGPSIRLGTFTLASNWSGLSRRPRPRPWLSLSYALLTSSLLSTPSLLGAFQKTFFEAPKQSFYWNYRFSSQYCLLSPSPVLQPDHPCQEASAATTAWNLLDTGISHPSWRHESGPWLRASEEDTVWTPSSLRESYRTASHCWHTG
ncbi:Dual specificity protein phosphatase PPS1 [Fusarium oxysporum f. sp. albedinis]|nr:Dual specificity protein phosphatase PPS1 [Fusarium oxysporum f. sp. albedinis]